MTFTTHTNTQVNILRNITAGYQRRTHYFHTTNELKVQNKTIISYLSSYTLSGTIIALAFHSYQYTDYIFGLYKNLHSHSILDQQMWCTVKTSILFTLHHFVHVDSFRRMHSCAHDFVLDTLQGPLVFSDLKSFPFSLQSNRTALQSHSTITTFRNMTILFLLYLSIKHGSRIFIFIYLKCFRGVWRHPMAAPVIWSCIILVWSAAVVNKWK